MDIPLLGSLKKTFSYLNPIPAGAKGGDEAKGADDADDAEDESEEEDDDDEDGDEVEGDVAEASSAPLSAILSFKEKLIFGSPDQSMLPWIDSISELCTKEDEEATAGNLVDDSRGGVTGADKPGMSLHDSTADTQWLSSHQSGLGLMPKDLVSVEPPESSRVESMASNKEYGSLRFETENLGTKEKKLDHHAIGMSEKSGMYSELVSPSRKQLRRIRTAPAITTKTRRPNQGISAKEKLDNVLGSVPSSSMSVVSQAFVGLLLYLVVGIVIYSWKQDNFSGSSTHSFIDAIYFCIVTMCTIGYGDITPVTPMAKLFSCAFVLIGFGFIDILLSGMVTYFLDKQESLLLSSMATGRHEVAKNYLVDIKKGRMRIRTKVALAFGVVIMCIGVGTIVMHFLESMGWLDSFYLSCMSVTTVGYGDHAFTTISGRLFASIWLLVSTLAVARSFIFLAEARIDKRHRLIAKFMLEKEMTAGDLVAADFDNDGCVSKSDFVVYKLKQMGKIVEKDIVEVCRQFNRLDVDNCGKITLSCLIRLHEASKPCKV